MTLPMAIVLSVLAATAFATAAVLQHEAVGDKISATHQRLGRQFFATMLRRPRWLVAVGMSGLGAVLNLTALSGAPVAVVQPITVLSVPMAVLIGMWRHHRRPGAAVWSGVAAAVAGVSTFVVLAASSVSSEVPATSHIVIAGAICAALVGLLMLVSRRGPTWARSLGWTGGAAVAYGLAAAYMKAIFVQLEQGVPLTSPTVWLPALVLLATYPVAAYMLQHAFVAGGAPEVVVGGLTVTDPIVAVLLGAFLLGESSRLGAGLVAAMIACAVAAVAGVIVLSRYHPEARRLSHPTPDDAEQAAVARPTDRAALPTGGAAAADPTTVLLHRTPPTEPGRDR